MYLPRPEAGLRLTIFPGGIPQQDPKSSSWTPNVLGLSGPRQAFPSAQLSESLDGGLVESFVETDLLPFYVA